MALAYCWEEAKGFPARVKKALAICQALKDLECILAIPEHKVNLPGGRAASQNDLFVPGRTTKGLVSIMVEGKVNELFGSLVNNRISIERSSYHNGTQMFYLLQS